MNIFKELVLSVYDSKSPKQFLENSKAKVFFFGVLLITLYFTIVVLEPLMELQIISGGIRKSAERHIPDFELSDNRLWIERPVKFDTDTSLLYVNTDASFELDSSVKKYMRGYSQVILMDSEKVIFKDQGQISQLYYSDLDIHSYTREALFEYLPYLYLFIAGVLILVYLFMTAFFFLGALALALLGMLVASCMDYQLTFGQLYILAVYSRTLPLLIKALLSFLPVGIPFFWIVNFSLSLLYISRAIKKLKEVKLTKPLEFTSDGNKFY